MTVPTASYISQLDPDLPADADLIAEGAAHLRLNNLVLQNTFPTASTPLTAAFADLNKVGVTPAQTSNDTTPASTEFTQLAILNAALTGVLPTQSGNNRKFLQTNGSTVSFAYAGVERETRSTNTILAQADAGIQIDATSTFTQTFTAAATLGDGWAVSIRNDGTGVITLDPNGAETIDGTATVNVYPGESCVVMSDGTNLFTRGLAPKGALIQLSTSTAATSAALDFANVFTTNFDAYVIRGDKLKPATDGAQPYFRTSTNSGVAYDAAGTDYSYAVNTCDSAGTPAGSGSAGAAQVILGSGSGVGNATSEWFSFEMLIYKPSDAAFCAFNWFGLSWTIATVLQTVQGSGARIAAADVDSCRFLFSSGNITSGTITVYGVKK